MTNLDSILKSRGLTFPTKVHLVKVMVFPIVVYVCESWTIKKAERRRIDAFELWCWRRLWRVPWISRRTNQSILKEISPEYSLEELMLKLKLQYLGYLMRRTDTFEKTLMLGKVDGGRRREWQTLRWLEQGSLTCSILWCRNESDTTERLKKQQQISLFSARARWKVEHRVILKWPMTGNQKPVALAASLNQSRG